MSFIRNSVTAQYIYISEFLSRLAALKIEGFIEALVLPYTWGNGILEYSELGAGGVEHDVIYFSKLFAPCSMLLNPISRFPKTQYSVIPSFHHSNWDEAPQFLTLARIWLKVLRNSSLGGELKNDSLC